MGKTAKLMKGVVTLAFLFTTYPAIGRAEDRDPHATGLIPPSAEQVQWERKNVIIPRKIRLNKMGFDRVNAHRRSKGQAPLRLAPSDLAPLGQEFTGTTLESGASLTPDESTTAGLGAMPDAVDNSALKYFPPIRSQGSIGSCAQWASIYYCFTHTMAMARDWDAKNGGDAYRFSPKFTYNLVNGGADSGSWINDGWRIAQKHGVATWAEWPYDSNYRAWPQVGSIWRNALSARADTLGSLSGIDTETGLNQLKTLLTNGTVVAFGTYINSWQFKLSGNDPSTTADDALVGKNVAYWLNGTLGAHGMTIVGYNDNIWVDINSNGVVDQGEKGALRIANSWGTGYREAGFTWLAYDALKAVSAVPGGPSSGRVRATQSNGVSWVTVRPSYTPKAVAEFTLNHLKRNQVAIRLGTSSTGGTTPSVVWSPTWVLAQSGGAYAFNGTLTPIDATFAFDFTDILPPSGTNRWYLTAQDTTTGDALTVKNFTLTTSDAASYAAGGMPKTVDATTNHTYIEATTSGGSSNSLPSVTAIANVTINEDGNTGPLSFTISDAETPASNLVVTGMSGNTTLVPASGITFGGSGNYRTVQVVPAANKNGTATITVAVKDAGGAVTSQSFVVTVTAVNDAPTANAQAVTVPPEVSTSLTLTGSDPDGDGLIWSVVSWPTHGTLAGTPPAVVYTPAPGYVGSDAFGFRVSDGVLTSATATVSLTVRAKKGGGKGRR